MDPKAKSREPTMSTPSPANPPNPAPRQPLSLEDSVAALARLNDQMAQLNAKLEYLRLLLKLGVK
jgi:hypothetical protein